MSSSNAMIESNPMTFIAKTYNITSLSQRKEVIHALAQDPLYDRLNANMQLSGMPPFHGNSRGSKTHSVNHKMAKIDIKKEHTIAATTHEELGHYQRIIDRYLQDDDYAYLACIKAKIEVLNDVSCRITHRLGDLYAIESILYNDNPDRDDLPEEFCSAVEAAKCFNSQTRGGMLNYHAYLTNHELVDGGLHGELREPPPLKAKSRVTERLVKAPKALIRRITSL